MGRIYDTVIAFLQEDHWHFEEIPDDSAIRFSFSAKSARFECFGRANEENEVFVFYSIIPIRVPQEQLLLTAELVALINYGLNIGNFEIDMNDGEIRYKTSIDVEGGELTTKMVETLIAVNISTTDRYYQAFVEVLYSDVEPRDAVARIEQPNSALTN